MFEGAAAETQTQSGTRRRGSVVRGGRCRATVPCIAQQNVTLQTSDVTFAAQRRGDGDHGLQSRFVQLFQF